MPYTLELSLIYFPFVFYITGAVLVLATWFEIYWSTINIQETRLFVSRTVSITFAIVYFVCTTTLTIIYLFTIYDPSNVIYVLFGALLLVVAGLLIMLNILVFKKLSMKNSTIGEKRENFFKKMTIYYYVVAACCIYLVIMTIILIVFENFVLYNRSINFLWQYLVIQLGFRVGEIVAIFATFFIIGSSIDDMKKNLTTVQSSAHE